MNLDPQGEGCDESEIDWALIGYLQRRLVSKFIGDMPFIECIPLPKGREASGVDVKAGGGGGEEVGSDVGGKGKGARGGEGGALLDEWFNSGWGPGSVF